MINVWNFLEAFSSITTYLWYICRCLHMFLALFPVLISVWRAGFRGDLFQLISKWLESVGWLARTSGSTAPPLFCQSFTKNNSYGNCENKPWIKLVYYKILLALAPGFVEPPCRLIQVSLGIYRVFKRFLACRVPVYHQCQQELQ